MFCSLYIDSVLASICRRSPQLVGFFSTCYHPDGPAQVALDDHSTVNATSLAQGCCISSICYACIIIEFLEDIRRDFANTKFVSKRHDGSGTHTLSMKGWTLETAYQDDIFGVIPVAIIPQYRASYGNTVNRAACRSITSPKISFTFQSSFCTWMTLRNT